MLITSDYLRPPASSDDIHWGGGSGGLITSKTIVNHVNIIASCADDGSVMKTGWRAGVEKLKEGEG